MIHDLERLLADDTHPGIDELRDLVTEVLGGFGVPRRFVRQEALSRKRVFRAIFEIGGQRRSLIVKRLPLNRSLRECAAARRWLGQVGLGQHAPPLRGVAMERRGRIAWHVYEDLGAHALVDAIDDPGCVAAAIGVIARVHTRFSRHPLLAECRLAGGELGAEFFEASLRDAQRNVEAMLHAAHVDERGRAIAARLCTRLDGVAQQADARARLLRERGGPETLLHGDLWTSNVLTIPCADGFDVRLIDWDHCGVGPVVYDLSAFLRRFPPQQRRGLLQAYRGQLEVEGWTWPAHDELNDMFDSAELARFANSITWRAVAIATAAPGSPPVWALEDLEEIDDWFAQLEPVVPGNGAAEDQLGGMAA